MQDKKGGANVQRIALGLFSILVLGLALAYSAGWPPFDVPAKDSKPVTAVIATDYCVFVDGTGSTTDDRKSAWPDQAKAFVKRLNFGDRIWVYPMDDMTSGQAALVSESIPEFDPTAGATEQQLAKGRLKEARKKAEDALLGLIAGHSPARTTDVFGALSRIRRSPNRKGTLVLFSDSLDSHFLERTCVTPENQSTLLSQADSLMGGARGLLDGVDVKWVTPARLGRPGCNTLPELRSFWKAVVTAQGGKLDFDPNVF